jgi:hypothetical protein
MPFDDVQPLAGSADHRLLAACRSRCAAILTRWLSPLLAALGVLVMASCGSESSGPSSGVLLVGNSTFGSGTDPDGYLVTIDGQAQTERVELNVGQHYDLAPGTHSIGLTDLAAGCATDTNNGASTGPNPQSAAIQRGDTTLVWFAVNCD